VRHLKKLGHYNSERHIVELVQQETGTGAARHPLAYLIEASDDICYLLGDLEDAIKKGVIRWDDAASEFEKDEEGRKLVGDTKEFTRKLSLLHTGRSLDESSAQYFRVAAMRVLVEAVADAFLANEGAIMSGNYTGDLMKGCKYASLFEAIDRFSRARVYASNETVRLEILGYRIISDLLEIFADAAPQAGNTFPGKLYQLISPNYRCVFEQREKWEEQFPDEYRRILLITDYICGMTDTFAVRLHSQLTQMP
jgi:dGTPase